MLKLLTVHATNLTGLGASRLGIELLPAIERVGQVEHLRFLVPASGPLSQFRASMANSVVERASRVLPNSMSRVFETALPYPGRRRGRWLVLGDLPLRGCLDQTLFLQSAHVVATSYSEVSVASALKYAIARRIFRANMSGVRDLIVQTSVMREAVLASRLEIDSRRVHVIQQPAPNWLLRSAQGERSNDCLRARGLRLFYPAAAYPHKNHGIINGIDPDWWARGNIDEMVLTIDEIPGRSVLPHWVKCVGRLGPGEVTAAYARADALLFLSCAESYGLPIIEAMTLGLPIICPDLPYARVLCRSQAIYFDSESPFSLQCAIDELAMRLRAGWMPDWTEALRDIPKSWDEVAQRFLSVVLG